MEPRFKSLLIKLNSKSIKSRSIALISESLLPKLNSNSVKSSLTAGFILASLIPRGLISKPTKSSPIDKSLTGWLSLRISNCKSSKSSTRSCSTELSSQLIDAEGSGASAIASSGLLLFNSSNQSRSEVVAAILLVISGISSPLWRRSAIDSIWVSSGASADRIVWAGDNRFKFISLPVASVIEATGGTTWLDNSESSNSAQLSGGAIDGNSPLMGGSKLKAGAGISNSTAAPKSGWSW